MTKENSREKKRPKEVIAIIPARGGSKGVPRKNIVELAGKPLIAYSILAARLSKNVTRVVVSTEDEKIAAVAEQWGAEIPFLRPHQMAQDDSLVSDAVSYTISELGGQSSDKAFVILFPTSPFRTPAFIDEMLEILFTGYQRVITVKSIKIDPDLIFIRDMTKGGSLVRLLEKDETTFLRKQYYRPYASLYANTVCENDKHYYHVLTDKCMLIDIDSAADLKWAETVICENLFDFGF